MEVDYIHANHFLPVSRRASSLSVTPSNFQEIAHSFVHIKSTELHRNDSCNVQVVSKSGNKDDEKFMRGPGQPTASSKSEINVKVQKTRSEISLIKNQLTQPTHLVGGNQGVLEFKLAKVEGKLTS